MILLLDNFDSFTYNLVDYFGQLGITCEVRRNNIPLTEIAKNDYDAVVLSPGPENPLKAGNLMEVLGHYVNKLPILGICLGHQAIGLHFGWKLVKAQKPMHGKVSTIYCAYDPLFKDLPAAFNIVRYHSLILENTTNVKDDLVVTAFTESQEIMAIRHTKYPIHGIQFHPEAALTEHGLQLLHNWLTAYDIGV
ncbi:MAG: anthranilate synthase component II [Flammeovirgaceae bacterium]